MKKRYPLIILPFLFLIQLSSQTIYGLTDLNELYRIDVENCTEEFVITVNSLGLPDITFHPNGNLYGISLGGSIVRIDTLAGTISLVHNIPYDTEADLLFFNALTVSADGTFYATGQHGDLFTYSLATNTSQLLGNLGFAAAGDLTFYDGELYVSTDSKKIVQVDIADPSNSSIEINNATNLFLLGLTSITEDCEGQTTYAISNTLLGSISNLYQVLWDPGIVVQLCNLENSYFGSASTTEFLPVPEPLLVQNISPTQPGCDLNNGSLTVSATGGTGSLVYAIDAVNFQASNLFENLAPGNYSVTVMDENECLLTQEIVLTASTLPEIIDLSATSTSCINSTGSISVTASSSVALTYSIDGVNFESTNVFTNLAAGAYTISVLDENNCAVSAEVEVMTAIAPEITGVDFQNTSCGENNGSISILANGGTGALAYTVNGLNYQPTGVFENLVPDEYILTVLDENDCSATSEVNIANSTTLSFIDVEPLASDCGGDNGAILLDLEADLNALQILVDSVSYPTITSINNLNCGDYTLEIVDQYNCRIESMVTISQNECPIYIPNAFSPNNDGVNDDFMIYPHPMFKGRFMDFKVFNKWGALVYQIQDFRPEDLKWVGVFKGRLASTGVYTYFLKFETEDGTNNIRAGDFTLMR